MRLHASALSSAQRGALDDVARVVSAESFYLAGGAALALHLGHRRSVDFDWFRRRRVTDPLKLARTITKAGVSFEITTYADGTLYGRTNGVKMSFIEYPYSMLEKPIESKEIGCSLASLQDIACMKLSAIAHRGAKKDFVDLYFLVQDIALDSMLDAYRKKFGVRDVAHVITALAYFDDADRQRMPVMIRRVGWRKVKAAIRAQVRRIG